MSITIVVVGTALASSFGTSLAMFLIQRYYDRRLEYYFNARLEELKASLNLRGDIRNQITSQRLEIYPSLAEAVYRLRNALKEMIQDAPLTLERALAFLRLAEGYTEKYYAARFYLELDGLVENLHDYKDRVLTAKNLILDWVYLTQDQPADRLTEINRVMTQLHEVYTYMDGEHRQLIQTLTKLTVPQADEQSSRRLN